MIILIVPLAHLCIILKVQNDPSSLATLESSHCFGTDIIPSLDYSNEGPSGKSPTEKLNFCSARYAAHDHEAHDGVAVVRRITSYPALVMGLALRR
jgi:hypothetical protein